jgi:predicted membrane protein
VFAGISGPFAESEVSENARLARIAYERRLTMNPNDPGGNFPGGNFDDWREIRRRRWEERRRRRMERMASGGFVIHGDRNGRLVFGTVILLLGILFLLQNLGIFYVDRLWQFWPVILIAMGIARVIDAPTLERRVWGGVVAVAGGILLANSLGLFPWRVWSLFWPAWLIFLGIFILVRGFGKQRHWTPSSFVHEVSTSSDDTLNALAIFGGINRRVQSQNFQGGEAVAVFGGIELDLRGASTTLDEIEIEANAVFGGIEMIVPDAWDVTVRGTGILGGYEDKTHRVPNPQGLKRPHLTINGGAVFGGVTVK